MNDHLVQLVALGGVIALGVWFVVRTGGKRKKVAQKIADGALILDVRTAGEFQNGHYPGAKNVPVQSLKAKADKLGPKDKPVVVYCASGARAGSAVAVLRSVGYTDVINAGGLSSMPSQEVSK